MRNLQAELSSLEAELADPSNPQLHKEREEDDIDPGELIRGLVDVRRRLDKIRKGKEGRGRLVDVVLGDGSNKSEDSSKMDDPSMAKLEDVSNKPAVQNIVEMDRRVGELERLIGSSTTALDEVRLCGPNNEFKLTIYIYSYHHSLPRSYRRFQG